MERRGGWLAGIWRIRAWCVAWWHSGREDGSDTEEESPSEQGHDCVTPVSLDTPLQSSVSRCTSMNVIREPYALSAAHHHHHLQHLQHQPANATPSRLAPRDTRSLPAANRLGTTVGGVVGGPGSGTRSASSDSVYTILIRLPGEAGDACPGEAPSIKMIPEVAPRNHNDEYSSGQNQANHLNRRPSAMPDIRIPLNAKIIPKQLAGKALVANVGKTTGKKKKKTQKADKKAAKTLSAILLTFIITWTPYNILVLLKPVTSTSARIPPQVWDFFYYLCYINSTINPVCYALCNASFRRTYLRILQCKWHNRNRAAMNRGFYN